MTLTEAITEALAVPIIGFLTAWFMVCVCGFTFVQGYKEWPPHD